MSATATAMYVDAGVDPSTICIPKMLVAVESGMKRKASSVNLVTISASAMLR